jgi:hypothetical protein
LPVARLQREDVSRVRIKPSVKTSSISFSPSPSMSKALRDTKCFNPRPPGRTDQRPAAAAHDVRYARLFVDLAQRRRYADKRRARASSQPNTLVVVVPAGKTARH